MPLWHLPSAVGKDKFFLKPYQERPVQVVYAEHTDPIQAVRLCAEQAASLPPAFCLAFCGGKHPPQHVLAAIRRKIGTFPIVGGSAAGTITRDGFGSSGFELALGLFSKDEIVPIYVAEHLRRAGEQETGRNLGEKARTIASSDAVVMLFYDSVAATAPLVLHPAAPLVRGIYEGLGNCPVHLIGGGLLTDLNLSDGWVFDGDTVSRHCAIALVFPPEIRAKTAIMHGCRPVSTFMEITRLKGTELFELDGCPALQVLEETLGMPLGTANVHDISLLATLGKKQGDRYAPFNEHAYINRLILSVNRDFGSITLFEPDFCIGDQVQIMSRDNALMLESVKCGIQEIRSGNPVKDVIMSLYIDCAGRASARSGSSVEEAEVALNESAGLGPFLGFYSGVEIAPVNNRSHPLDWTAVYSLLYREERGGGQ